MDAQPHAAQETSLRHAFDFARAPDADDAEVAFYREQLADDGPTLVALCGIGRLLVPLARSGARVQGVEPSAAAIAICQRRLADAGVDALLLRQPLDALNLAFRYRAGFIPGGAWQRLLDPTRALAGLARVAAHLVPPAKLAIEFVIPAEARHAPGAPVVEVRSASEGATRIVWRSETRVDVEGRRVDRESRYERRAGHDIVAREVERSAFTWYAEDEIAPMLEAAGFAAVSVQRAPWPGDNGDELRLVALAHRAGS